MFEPDIMAEFVDFCQQYDLEIFDESLYISLADNASGSSNNTSLISAVETFLQRCGPLLQRL